MNTHHPYNERLEHYSGFGKPVRVNISSWARTCSGPTRYEFKQGETVPRALPKHEVSPSKVHPLQSEPAKPETNEVYCNDWDEDLMRKREAKMDLSTFRTRMEDALKHKVIRRAPKKRKSVKKNPLDDVPRTSAKVLAELKKTVQVPRE